MMRFYLRPQFIIPFILFFLFSLFVRSQKDVLVILAHPSLSESHVNKTYKEKLKTLDRVEIHDLYQFYPEFIIDVKTEQELIKEFDYIVFQFPLYWFSAPALLKKWQDEVFTSRFAIDNANNLVGKHLLLVVSAGGTEADFQKDGLMEASIEQILQPFTSFAKLSNLKMMEPFITYAVPNPTILNIELSESNQLKRINRIESQAEKLLHLISRLKQY